MTLHNYSDEAKQIKYMDRIIGRYPVLRACLCDTKMILLFLARVAKQTVVLAFSTKSQGKTTISQETIPHLKFKVYMQKTGYPM